jgi:hypothetical protein
MPMGTYWVEALTCPHLSMVSQGTYEPSLKPHLERVANVAARRVIIATIKNQPQCIASRKALNISAM